MSRLSLQEDRSPNERGASLGAILFSIPFILVGFGVLIFGLWPIYRNYQSQSWIEVPATILSAELNENYDSDGSTYSVAVHYSYEVQGQHFTSDKIDFYTGSDSSKSFHENRYRILKPYIGSTRLYPAYVDPADPSDAVLFREVRWLATGFLTGFGSIFLVVGLVVVVMAVKGTKVLRFEAEQKQRYPEKPWLLREDWSKRVVHCSTKGSSVALAIVTFLVNGISAPIPFAIADELSRGSPNYLVLLLLVFNLVGLFLLYVTILSILRWRRFGRSEFHLHELPFQIGGELKGTLVASEKLQDGNPFLMLTLQCVESTTSGSGKNRQTTTKVLHETGSKIQLSGGLMRQNYLHVPIRVPIDSSAPATSEDTNPRIQWILRCTAELPGVDFSANFDVPVFYER
jgi:hypothetical protein